MTFFVHGNGRSSRTCERMDVRLHLVRLHLLESLLAFNAMASPGHSL